PSRVEPARGEVDPQPAEKPKASPGDPPPPLAGAAIDVAPNVLSEQLLADGWIALFDGESLYGWHAESKADWQVVDGTIVAEQGDVGLLRTTSRFANYVLKLEFRSAAGTNSGVFLRTPGQPSAPESDCYELNIADSDNPFPTASLVKRKKAEGDFDSADWQSYEVTVDGSQVAVKLDGKTALEYSDPNPLATGFIGLQFRQGKIEFRNIHLKPLGLQPLFNGKDLEGWTEPADQAAKFSVTERGELHVANGPGHLESVAAFADFIIQLECRTHAADLNSGLFFRAIPGSKMDGYESQIHNGFHNNDRRQPKDSGTGAIFRRQAARLVAASDNKWFAKTVIADGNHFAVWVNGFLVTDWSDERKPDPNPRRGSKLAAGVFMLQGHDPTTDLSFRNVRAVETRE
ncbi:MAG: DUF1080 domain-containing protein, partial [Pirellulaceae bacterium]|nr:DUF1080 domain-containing protein [Pirellulaceae bacterium]